MIDIVSQAQEKFSLLDRISEGICALQSDYTVLFWNYCLEEWTQIPRSKILGNSIIKHFPHLNQPRYTQRLEQIFQGGPPTIFSSQLHEYLIPAPLPQGRWRIQHTTVTSLPALDGVGFDALISAQDVTDLTFRVQEYRKMRDRALEAKEAAEAANRVKDEFLAIVSHELRSPLNPILGWSKLLKKRQLDEATIIRALDTIERNAHAQAQLIDDLLDISRILRGQLKLNFETVDLATTIAAALETVQLAAEAKSIQIKLELDADVGSVRGDGNRLRQVVWNLLSNAVKFTPAGGLVEIHLSMVHGDRRLTINDRRSTLSTYAQIQVSDTGRGINPDFLPYVFESFRQADSSTTRSLSGLGLGLAIVRRLVELHGGTVKAESAGEGQGATFTVQLPSMKDKVQERSATDVTTDVFACLPLVGVQILVVDDEPDTRDYLSFVLKQAGATVTVAASASEALQALARSKPDVLLSDIGMPDVDGYMLMQQVQVETLGAIPAVALTAYASEIERQQALAAGFDQHISKPVEPEELVKAIARAIALAHKHS